MGVRGSQQVAVHWAIQHPLLHSSSLSFAPSTSEFLHCYLRERNMLPARNSLERCLDLLLLHLKTNHIPQWTFFSQGTCRSAVGQLIRFGSVGQLCCRAWVHSSFLSQLWHVLMEAHQSKWKHNVFGECAQAGPFFGTNQVRWPSPKLRVREKELVLQEEWQVNDLGKGKEMQSIQKEWTIGLGNW